MSVVVVIARFLVAAVFVLAGVSKAFDRRGTREAFDGFGVPASLAAPGAVLLAWVELATATLLVVPRTSWWGGLAALVLLAVFSVGIAVNLGRGRTPDCHCFGQLSPSPIGPKMLVRNLVFAVPALVVVLAG